jgi:serine/threonine-protein kinase
VTPEQWQRVREVFAAALEVPRGAPRAAYLEHACAGDPVLRADVEAMLVADAVTGSVLESSPDTLASALAVEAPHRPMVERVGPYRIVRELGRGGMGTVYLAERDDVAKRVALKVVRGGPANSDATRRFFLERQMLARLAHPNIAPLLDAGVTGDGTPWFAMEFVDGETLIEHADRRRLSINDRLALFARVCAAVSYAHRNLLVHRDVKPSNILVSADGEPKLLDFGIAKLLGDDDAGESLTATGARLLTPEYAAPEQMRGDPVTTATDIHALGLVLSELLTGRRAQRPRSRSLSDMERTVLHVEALAPSSVVTRGDDDDPAALARARGTDPARLRHRLRGDLDAIVLKALRKNPHERYLSVDALADDLERHRRRLPVLARRGSRTYRARRFVDRNRTVIAVAALVLAGATAVGLRESVLRSRAELARDDARVEAAKAEQVTNFLVGLFDAADASSTDRQQTDTLRLRDYLAQVGDRVLSMKAEPQVKLQALNAVARMYSGRALDDQARPVLDSALALARRIYPQGHADLVRALRNFGEYHRNRSKYAESERELREALAVGRRVLPPDNPEIAAILTSLGELLRLEGKYAGADSALRAALVAERASGGPAWRVGHVENNLGLLLWERGRYAEAEPILRQALAALTSDLPPDHPDVTATQNNLGILLSNSGRAAEAEPLLRAALEMKLRSLGPNHPRVANARANLAATLNRLGRHAEAVTNARQALAIAVRLYGERNVSVATYRRDLAVTLLADGDIDHAEREARAALRIHRELLPASHLQVGRSLVALGRILRARGSAASALPLLARGDSILRSNLGAQHRWVAVSQSALGACLIDVGRAGEGEPLLRESIERFRSSGTLLDPEGRDALAALVRRYESTGRSREASVYREAMRAAG